MTPPRSSLPRPLPFPSEQQKRNYPKALTRDCETCYAKAGEPCMPSSLAIPHLARCREKENAK